MSESQSERVSHILLVEDNAADVYLIREGLHATEAVFTLHVVGDGLRAIEFIDAGAPRPNLVILDLNIPKLNGHDVLRSIKGNEKTKQIPVVVFSSSNSANDIQTAYRLSANSYVRKPSELNEYMHAVAAIERFWGHIVALPA
jgi:CheY-like chemotaxis protein